MSDQQSKAVKKMADRIVKGYEAVHSKNYQEAKELLEPLVPLFHQEEKPNVTLLCYTSIAQLGSKDIDSFLQTYEELKNYTPSKKGEKDLVKRVDEMFEELMHAINLDSDSNESH
ncbi:hypothetical protein [Salipaludibacillus aurantiacus]|jgi:hypothetical protein|uniref:Tetratricopeptide repeat-containing protein n=1 Tax=Salipaludibacillus aurantiacus TaxID=1601833 RepID=A0A1H9TBY0_9BACI|nr:hypothetical protein [Salipaludibacillus aurantiacus]SER94628.1 hypothetical protein SAMN05518684_105239 [Salipaludibacillus aurantiacus]